MRTWDLQTALRGSQSWRLSSREWVHKQSVKESVYAGSEVEQVPVTQAVHTSESSVLA